METMSSAEVAALYGVAKMTVLRWTEAGKFGDVPRLDTGTGQRRPYLFNRAAVLAQHQQETQARSTT